MDAALKIRTWANAYSLVPRLCAGSPWALFMCVVVFIAAMPAFATGAKKKAPIPKNVKGLVLDSADIPVSGAAVSLKDVQTGKTIAIYSGSEGNFEFTDLDRGHDYEIRASLKDSASEVRKVSSFDNRNTIPMNLKLQPSPSK